MGKISLGKLIAWIAIYAGSAGLAFHLGGAIWMFVTLLALGVLLLLVEAA